MVFYEKFITIYESLFSFGWRGGSGWGGFVKFGSRTPLSHTSCMTNAGNSTNYAGRGRLGLSIRIKKRFRPATRLTHSLSLRHQEIYLPFGWHFLLITVLGSLSRKITFGGSAEIMHIQFLYINSVGKYIYSNVIYSSWNMLGNWTVRPSLSSRRISFRE